MRNNAPTLGAMRQRLTELGYQAVSAIAPQGLWVSHQIPNFADWLPHEQSEHPAAVACRGAQNLAALLLEPIADEELDSRVRTLLTDRGLLAGPRRIGSDGRECYVLRIGFTEPRSWQALEGAVGFAHARRLGMHDIPALIPLDGRWEGGTLLEVRYADLPTIAGDEITAIIGALEALPYQLSVERRPPPQPSIEAWLS